MSLAQAAGVVPDFSIYGQGVLVFALALHRIVEGPKLDPPAPAPVRFQKKTLFPNGEKFFVNWPNILL